MIQRYFGYLLSALLLLGIALGAAIITMRFAIHGAESTVPKFTGLTAADAARKAESAGLDSTVVDRYYSAEMPAGHVLLQSPDAGTVVRRGWTVRLTESLGPQKLSIPNVVGMDERLAGLTIRQAGLDVGTVADIPSSTAKPGTVISQDPPPDSQGVDRPRVSILLAAEAAPPSGGFVLPSWVGLSVAQAAAAVNGAGLKMSAPTYTAASIPKVADPGSIAIPVPAARVGVIIAQKPAPGSRVFLGDTVQFTVAH